MKGWTKKFVQLKVPSLNPKKFNNNTSSCTVVVGRDNFLQPI